MIISIGGDIHVAVVLAQVVLFFVSRLRDGMPTQFRFHSVGFKPNPIPSPPLLFAHPNQSEFCVLV